MVSKDVLDELRQLDEDLFKEEGDDRDSVLQELENIILEKKSKELVKKFSEKYYPQYLQEIISESEMIELQKQCVLEYRKELRFQVIQLVAIIISTKNLNFQIECVKKHEELGLYGSPLADIIIDTNNTDFQIECVKKHEELGLYGSPLVGIIIATNNTDFQIQCVEKHQELGINSKFLIEIMKYINNFDFLKKCVLEKNKLGFDDEIVDYIIFNKLREEDIIYILEKCNDAELSKKYRTRGDIKIIFDNLDLFLRIERRIEYKDSILRLYSKHENILRVDFKILDCIKYLGENKLNQILYYPNIIDKIIKLSNIKIQILAKGISYFEEQYKTEDWTRIAEIILDNINSIDEDLLAQILEQADNIGINMENLIHLFINSNNLNINTIEDFNNYDEIWQKRYTKSNKTVIDYKSAIIEKAFRHGLKIAEELVKRFGNDIDKIEDKELKKYINALKKLLNLEDADILEKIFNSIEPTKIKSINILAIEKLLKREYAKLYNNGLFIVENATKIEEKELGENVYESGINFDMILTSISAYSRETQDNYFESWNRPDLSTQQVCCFHIRNDMMGTPSIPYVCFGFNKMAEDCLISVGCWILSSGSNKFVPGAVHSEVFYSPNNQINNTTEHNEIDYYRMQNGEKKQPDYIVVFRAHKKIDETHKKCAKQAQKDFGGKLPIVIVDVDKCLENEKNIVREMVANYKLNPTQEMFKQIKQKIRNNDETCKSWKYRLFSKDINLEELEGLLKNTVVSTGRTITTQELQVCYGEITPEEREKVARELAQTINKINLGEDR